jgi:hypothetical protein
MTQRFAIAVAAFCGQSPKMLGDYCPRPAVVTSGDGDMASAAACYVREACQVGVEFRVERPVYLGEGIPHVVNVYVAHGILYSLNVEEVA